jgi:formylglycine-generating enzyme required for sulfatase activity
VHRLWLTLAVLAGPSLAETPDRMQAPPPGLVRIAGGRVTVGSPVAEIERRIAADAERARWYAGETPRHTASVEDFFLMVTEVTHEQYAAYVRATGAKPPLVWGEAALDAARNAHLDLQAERNARAKARGGRPERVPFDAADWWERHWRESEWSVPSDQLDRPVVHVSYADALGYCRWSGLRPMSELEYQCAARGASERDFPWGDEWDDRRYAASQHFGADRAQPVGSFPDGARDGVFDLAGNVWEWTSSPYLPYPRYEGLRVRIGRGVQARELEARAPFDADRRVVVGGSFLTPREALRVATRLGADRSDATDALGFRCAASPLPGLDLARAVIDGLDRRTIPRDLELLPAFAVLAQRWQSDPGTARVDGYRVITACDHVMFVPARGLLARSAKALRDRTTESGPELLGLLALTRPVLVPALDPGVYAVAWRGAGRLPRPVLADGEGAAAPFGPAAPRDFTRAPGFDPGEDLYLFFDRAGEPVATLPAPAIDYGRLQTERGHLRVEPFVPAPPRRADDAPAEPLPMDTLVFRLQVAGGESARGFGFELALKVEPGTVDASWRLPDAR